MRVLEEMTVGERLRRARMAKGLSQTDLAKKLHIRPNNVSMWENEQKPIPDKRVDQLINVLDVSSEYLFSGINNNPPQTSATMIPLDLLRQCLEEIARTYDFIDAEPTEFAEAVANYCAAELDRERRLKSLSRK